MNKKSTDAVTKMLVVGIGALAIILVFASVYVAVFTGKKGEDENDKLSEVTQTSEQSTTANTTKHEVVKYNRTIALVKYSDSSSKKMVVYDINNDGNITFKIDSSTELKDAYGTDIALSQFDKGDIVEIKYNEKNKMPKYIKISAMAWERKGIKDISINEKKKTIKVKNDTYKYTDELITLENGKSFELDSISDEDEMLLRGYKDIVWTIELSGRHGSVKLENYDVFVGGTLDIVGYASKDIVPNMIISLPPGNYNISLTKVGVPPVNKKVKVVSDQETVLDLSGTQSKVGEVDFVSSPKGATVYVDGKKINTSKKKVLDFGRYKVKAKLEGYDDWRGEILVNQAYTRFKIDLGEKQRYIYINKPEGAEAYLDGVLVGVIPTKAPFVGGSHKIHLRQDGYKTSEVFSYNWSGEPKDEYLSLPAMTPLIDGTEPETITLSEITTTEPTTTTTTTEKTTTTTEPTTTTTTTTTTKKTTTTVKPTTTTKSTTTGVVGDVYED